MATLATVNNRIFDAAGYSEPVALQQAEAFRLRPIPNEDVYFFVKRIDNSRVVREADPAAVGTCWRVVIGSLAAVLLLTGLLLPGAYSLLAGYQINSLQAEHQRLEHERAALDLEVATLLSPERLNKLAASQTLVDPAPGSVVYLNPTAKGSVAMNLQ